MTQDSELTIEEIQGRLNQREIPWLAEEVSPGDSAVTFKPKDRSAISLGWDRSVAGLPSFDEVVDFLASYRGART